MAQWTDLRSVPDLLRLSHGFQEINPHPYQTSEAGINFKILLDHGSTLAFGSGAGEWQQSTKNSFTLNIGLEA